MTESDGSRRGGGPHAGAGGRCVLLAPRAGAAPAGLVAGLVARGLAVDVVVHPAPVMVELGRGGVRALVVIEPALPRDRAALLAAVRHYYPTVVCWQYEPAGADGVPRLRKFGAVVAAADRAANGAAAPAAASPAPPPVARSPQPGAPPPVPVLTQEEVAMLIGRPFEEEVIVSDEADEP